ncbi:MAG: acylneuraminate cytidylyltransferase family protein [Eudoraea sp.]|nr:acylneuraminate cytidylyltransferase family protein [Eudoraea sp.]
MKIVALMPMKGNSERVPEKNLKPFRGRPLYQIVLNELVKSKYIDKIIVNTDSKVIENSILQDYGKKVVIHHRPEALLGDTVSMNRIIDHDIQKESADLYIQTHSTNPLLKIETLDEAIKKMLDSMHMYDSIFSVTRMNTRLYDKDGNPYNHNPEQLLRTQDLDPLYEENSNFYIFTKESFANAGGKRIGLNPLMFEIDKLEAVDIDEPQDFIIAEVLHGLLRN